MRLRVEKAISVISLLVEGCSIRSVERVTGVHRDTILDLLVLVGTRCERLLENRIKNIAVKDIQADEIWGFVAMKEKTKKAKGSDNPTLGMPIASSQSSARLSLSSRGIWADDPPKIR